MAYTVDVALEGFQKLQKAVCDHYKSDPTSAVVNCAWIEKRSVWYMSVCRYCDAYGESKEVVAKAEHCDWIKCFMQLAKEWLVRTGVISTSRVNLINFVQKEQWLAQ